MTIEHVPTAKFSAQSFSLVSRGTRIAAHALCTMTIAAGLLAIGTPLTGSNPVEAQQKSKTKSVKKRRSTSSYERSKAERNKSSVSVISGGISGTYIRFATDLANVLDDLKTNSMRILPIAGRGGGQNVLDILFLRGIDMGITQQDHLAFFKQRDPALFANIEKRVHYITKLYNAEFHLVANKSVKSLDDLKGKTVNLWRPWSATDIAGQTIFKILGIDAKVIHIDTQLALEKVRKGEIAATVLLAGAPIGGYTKINQDANMHFVPVGPKSLGQERYGKLLEVYLPARLTNKDYPKLVEAGTEVPTIASGAVLAAYNWPAETERYKKVARFVDAFFSNFEKFRKKPRHPKWRQINIAATVPGWTRFRAAQEWIDQQTQAQASRRLPKPSALGGPKPDNDKAMQAAFNEFLTQMASTSDTGTLSPRQKQALYTKFSQWWQNRAR